MAVIRSRAVTFGDNINTDIISPPQYMELSIEDSAKYCMSAVDPDFYKKAATHQILAAGSNFGSGSSRETSPLTLKYLGIRVVVAKFFARIFYRNAINVGLVAIECPDTDRIDEGDELEVDYAAGEIRNITKAETYTCSKIPDHLERIIEEGGLVEHLKKQFS